MDYNNHTHYNPQITGGKEMKCAECVNCKTLSKSGQYVRCTSKSHARFMDTWDKTWRERLRHVGHITLTSCEWIGEKLHSSLECQDFQPIHGVRYDDVY